MKTGLTITVDIGLIQKLEEEAIEKEIKVSALINQMLKERYIK